MSIWSDINASIGLNGQQFILTDTNAIEGAIYNILRCPIGARAWYPTFGSQLPFLLWEPVGQKTASAIRLATIQAIEKWESRVQVIGALTTVNLNSDNTGYYVNIGYIINSTGTVGSSSFEFVK